MYFDRVLQRSLSIADQIGLSDEDAILKTLINLGGVYGLAGIYEHVHVYLREISNIRNTQKQNEMSKQTNNDRRLGTRYKLMFYIVPSFHYCAGSTCITMNSVRQQ